MHARVAERTCASSCSNVLMTSTAAAPSSTHARTHARTHAHCGSAETHLRGARQAYEVLLACRRFFCVLHKGCLRAGELPDHVIALLKHTVVVCVRSVSNGADVTLHDAWGIDARARRATHYARLHCF